VTVDPGTRTVLQMPRGNLEGIHPRIITLKKAIEDIENTNYGKAFKSLRQHKIDINLLYDVNPGQFIANIAKFVTEVNKVDYLNLFINSLVDDEMGQELAFMRPKDKEEEIREEHKKFMSENIEGQK
jgi:elongator complex protein 1